jgi:hypothetical protein
MFQKCGLALSHPTLSTITKDGLIKMGSLMTGYVIQPAVGEPSTDNIVLIVQPVHCVASPTKTLELSRQ